MLLHLLCDPGVDAHIPPALGARDQVEQGNEERDCWKGAILEAPDIMINPLGKRRVAVTFPSHEITIAHVRSAVSSTKKTETLERDQKIRPYSCHDLK